MRKAVKEVQDLNRIEYAIYYWSEVLAVLICGVFIYLNWQMGIICVASGYVVYKIMWFSRKSIFQMGLSRFYFFGIMIYTNGTKLSCIFIESPCVL